MDAESPLFPINRTFMIAEAGSNWRMGCFSQDLAMAYRLIDLAADAEADAVKFQVFRAETTYAFGSGPCSHLKEKGIGEDIGAVFRGLEMPDEMIPLLAERCKSKGVEFMASFFSKRDFATIDPHVRVHKIASPELHHPELLKLAAVSKKPTLLSTGITTEEEIEWALNLWEQAHGGLVALLQCTVQYPTDPKSINLNALKRLQARFHKPVGLSDHSRDPVAAPIAAVALGARVIEKHFTLHRGLVGPDHNWAITAEELKELVRAVRLVEEMLGQEVKTIDEAEMPLRRFSRRSLQVTRDVAQGERFKLGENYAILRPGTCSQGEHPRLATEIEGAVALRPLKCGEGIVKDSYCKNSAA